MIAAIRQVKTSSMDNQPDSDLVEAFAAALDWWRDAGVDCTFSDDPVDWVRPREDAKPVQEQTKPSSSPSAPAAVDLEPPAASIPDRAAWPQDLADFAQWWLSEPWLDAGRVAERVAPRGREGAELMAIVAEPEAADEDRLLSGPQGNLLDAIAGAMGFADDRIYVASALPRHTPMADWDEVARRGMGEVLAHHVTLAKPKRIVVFGGNILPLFGNDLPNSAENLRRFNHEGTSIPLLAATDLAVLLARPRAKARLWQLWLDWTGIGTT
ncbi:MAG: hypothetical protein H6917_08150 [Novosphingobium sp.]|nr:hypothetical protein [Novosphingobium sp.]MCP5402345.1 hypothetical protein [Novosphingobium sp.]